MCARFWQKVMSVCHRHSDPLTTGVCEDQVISARSARTTGARENFPGALTYPAMQPKMASRGEVPSP